MNVGLLHLVFSFQLLLLSAKNEKDIWCANGHRKETKICQCIEDSNYPAGINQQKTAPTPEDMKVSYIAKNNTKIKIHIEWKYKGSYLDSSTTGFFFEIFKGQTAWSYKCNVDTSTLKHKNRYIMFHYKIISDPLNLEIQPKNNFTFKLFALPIYGVDDTERFMKSELEIPGCKHELIQLTRNCRTNKQTTVTNKRTRRKNNGSKENALENVKSGDTNRIVVISVLVILLCAIAVIIVCFVQKERHRMSNIGSKKQEFRKVVIIAEVNALSVANRIIVMLHKYSREEIKLYCNLWQITEVGQVGIVNWIANKLKIADIVIFLIENQKQATDNRSDTEGPNQTNCSAVFTAINIAENFLQKNHLKAENHKFIAANLYDCKNEQEIIPFCTHYCLKTELNKLLKHAINSQHHKSKRLEQDQKRLQNLVSGISSTKMMTFKMNHLDDTPFTKRSTTSSVVLNIPQEEFASIECNE